MRLGFIKWFNAERGVGMIEPVCGGRTIFVFERAIMGSDTLEEGQAVEYDIDKGPHRAQVRWARALPDPFKRKKSA